MKYNREGFVGKIFFNLISNYDYDKYWYMRGCVVDNKPKKSKLVRMIYLLKIKKMEAANASSFGTAMGAGAHFENPPILPHGLSGSFISHTAKIGKNCVIMQNVIIGSSKKKAPVIGDNCIIGAGAIIVGGINIGDNVRIGAGCVVAKDIEDDCTVVMQEPRILKRRETEGKGEETWIF